MQARQKRACRAAVLDSTIDGKVIAEPGPASSAATACMQQPGPHQDAMQTAALLAGSIRC
jgi:hypothetical protein